MENNEQRPGDKIKMKDAFSIVHFLAQGHATCLTVFLHIGFGMEALGWNGLAALLVQMIYVLIAPSAAMGGFFVVWLFVMLCQRIDSWRRYTRGEIQHSRYTGWPWLVMKIPFVKSELSAKTGIEPLLCAVVGAFLLPVSEPLGAFVMFGFASLLFVRGIESQMNHVRVRRMRDAQVEMQQSADRFKGVRNDY